jgi:hypothetical protein
VITKQKAIMSLRPGVEWSMNGDDVENIIWHTPNVEPLTEAQVKTEIIRLEKIQKIAEKEKAEKKESATNKLKALGLTDAEVEALLG